MPISISQPTPNQAVQTGELSVSGTASGTAVNTPDGIEGLVIVWVMVAVDGGSPVKASLTASSAGPAAAKGALQSYNFAATVTVPATSGPHSITATSTSDVGEQETAQVSVTIGKPAIAATLIGTATVTTGNSPFPGPYTTAAGTVVVGLEFSGDGTSVRMTSFQPIVVGPIGPAGNVTITQNSGTQPGVTNTPSEGSLNLAVSLHLASQVAVLGTADVSVHFTTDAGDGSPLDQANRMIVLVDDPKSPPSVTAGGLGGLIIGGTAIHIKIIGNVSPMP